MAPTSQQLLGRIGERLALEHYQRRGFVLLGRNKHTRSGELDLVVCDAATIVFVEVKTRLAGGLDPLFSITPRKVRRMRIVAAEWLAAHPEHPHRPELRLDAVGVVIDARGRLVALDQLEAIG